MSSNRNKHIECDICKNLIRSDTLQRHLQRTDHQPAYPTRSDSLKIHEKKYGEGLRTQTVNDQMKWGYGLKSKHEQKHDGGVDDSDTDDEMKECGSDSDTDDEMKECGNDSDTDDEMKECGSSSDKNELNNLDDDIGRYVWRWSEKNNNKNHSPLLPRDIRAIIVGKSGAGKSVFLTYLLLEPGMLDYDNLIVCGPSLHQPLYNIMNKGFSMKLSKDQVRSIFKNQDRISQKVDCVDDLFEGGYEKRCKGGVDAEFIDDIDLIPDPSEFDVDKKNVLVLDDVLLGPQNKIEDMYTRGRHNGIDTFYIAQNYFKIPRQTVRENANLIVLFPQDMKNLNHIYNDHCAGDGISCQQFHDFCSGVWRSGKHKYVVLDLTRDADKGKYRINLKDFWIP